MDLITIAQFAGTLLALLGVIALMAIGAQRFNLVPGMARFGLAPGRVRRLSLIESLPLDPRRRLVLVRADGRDHLLLIGGESDLVIQSAPALAIEEPAP
jgi:flagellar protein FliO/FliZ